MDVMMVVLIGVALSGWGYWCGFARGQMVAWREVETWFNGPEGWLKEQETEGDEG